MHKYAEIGKLSDELRQMGVEIDPGDPRPIQEIAQAFGICAVQTEVQLNTAAMEAEVL